MSDSSNPNPLPRRGFLGLAGLAASGAALLGLAAGMVRLLKPRAVRGASGVFRAGKPGDIAIGTVRVFPKQKVRLSADERGITAISLECTHLGCTVRETPDGFQCPCHGARFDKEGEAVKGPARLPLRRLALSRAADGSILVDPSTPVEPGTFLALAPPLEETKKD